MKTKQSPESFKGLSIDFVMRKNPMIQVDGDDLDKTQLSEHDLNMLQSVNVPRHLPVLIEEMDGKISLMYGYKGKKILAIEAARERLDLHQYMIILMEVSSVLKRATDYMLNSEHYILDPNWIMIGETWEDLFLLYLPIKEWYSKNEKEESVGDQLKRFALALMPYVNELEGTVFQQFIAALDRKPFSLDEVISTLQSAQQTAQPVANSNEEELSWHEDTTDNTSFEWEEEVYVPESAQSFPWQAGLRGGLAAAALIGLYFIWKSYVLDPQDGMLFMSSGLTMMLLASAITVARWKAWQGEKPSQIPSAEKTEAEQQSPAEVTETSNPEHKPSPWRKVQTNTERQPVMDTAISTLEQTVRLTSNDKTVLLQGEVKPYLKLDQKPEEIRYLDQSSFVVGRDSKHAQWVINETGISRNHFEIVPQSNGCNLRDLGSSNGTLLNDKPVAPFKWYDLKDQDQIKIGQKVFLYNDKKV